jgi:hypothetical protein
MSEGSLEPLVGPLSLPSRLCVAFRGVSYVSYLRSLARCLVATFAPLSPQRSLIVRVSSVSLCPSPSLILQYHIVLFLSSVFRVNFFR